MIEPDPVVIIGAARTAIGAFQGAFSKVRAPCLAAAAVRGALTQSQVASQDVQELYMGCVLTAGMGQAPARQVIFEAGLPLHVLGVLLNKVCGSGLQSVLCAADSLLLKRCDVAVAGGMESMSQAPYLLDRARAGYRMGHKQALDHILFDGLEDSVRKGCVMGVLAEETAARYKFTREQQDAFAVESVRRSLKAIQDGALQKEIVPVPAKSDLLEDEIPARVRLDKIPSLRPVFKEGGTVTAANSSSLADGAAALVLTRRSVAEARGYQPLAVIHSYHVHATEPSLFTTAPVGSIRGLMEKAGWRLSDVDFFEINEAFCVVPMAVLQDLQLGDHHVNIHGGSCALGHPIGATGARILVTLLNTLTLHGGRKGVASLCIGGGEAISIAVERCV